MVAYYALGFTPWVLLAAGIVFILVALSYAEGTAAIPETGGAATFVRRAFNDPLGFMTGWALFLDYLIVIALAALFVPHYLGDTVGWNAIKDEPWDVVVGVVVIAAIACVRLVRRPSLYRLAIGLAGIALVAQLLLIVFGFVYFVSASAFGEGVDLGTAPTWSSIGFAIPWRCSRTPAWRPSPTSPPRRASPARPSRAVSSAGSAPRCRLVRDRHRRHLRVPGRA